MQVLDSDAHHARIACDVLVVGAGLVGSALAAALRPSGLHTVLLDAQAPVAPPPEAWDSRVYAISPGSQRFLAACGAWQRLPADRSARVGAMRVYGDDGAEIVFSAYDCGIPELCFIVESRELQAALAAANAEDGGPITLFGSPPQTLAIGEDAASVDIADGSSIEARLVAGADGTRSWV